ncbi:hypothetical protein DCAR_0936195 [Daucus carota subsp. sativus]|uniref:EngC GTPase domain-containing protein n=1 Tax=Daucus carota subsp. sativus TaxID=79200 RepID=A0AAF0Y1G1_DAUCS|nr:PREDICTED: putative ribosome biogenesis GTPase RsgA [Daucus carota subsp. sativus]XP_017225645.1 PREDICTED: putative ribosome biogenesis GTPase RsgA [Daucus carota subsp. sativus]XP_017225646.1 PREDICTED: putative ribosome biogenesis GTPase RsgA [Daucus carota subsp. sativus]WOH16637.1 hypothetical protein DCAR_0936195 [Daucus carota subsp. sativus]
MIQHSIPMFRHTTTAAPPHLLLSLRRNPTKASSSRSNNRNPNNNKFQPTKHLLKAREAVRNQTSLSPSLPLDHTPTLSPDQAIGMVASAQANFMRVIVQISNTPTPTLGVELLCVVRALLKKIKRRVSVGDKVLVGSIDWVDGRGMIENVFQRKSEILDPPVANVDHLLVFFSLDQPKLEPFSLTRFLVEAESTGIPITLVLNKMELVDETTLITWKSRLRSWGYEPVFCSVETKHGLDTLKFILREKTSVIVGPSGVGKSSLINALRGDHSGIDSAGEDDCLDPFAGSKWFEDQRVGEVSVRSGRGKHTTRHVSLLPLSGGGYLADTPGFNQPSLMKVTRQSLPQYFPEIQKILSDSYPETCSFNDCLHLGDQGCIVKGDWERFPHYFQLHDEIKIREGYQLRTLGTKREGDVRYKIGDLGVKQAEPRLEPKKHRRQSRKKINQSVLQELDELDDDNLSDDDNNDPILRAMKNEHQ